MQALALLAAIGAIALAREFLVPVVVAVALSVLAWPLMLRLQRLLRVRALCAGLVVVLGGGLSVALTVPIASQVSTSAERMPDVLRLAARDVQKLPGGGGGPGIWQRTQQALEELDRAVARATGTGRGVGATAARANGSIVATVIGWSSAALAAAGRSLGAVALQVGVILLLWFFLLCSGERLAGQLAAFGRRPPLAVERVGGPERRRAARSPVAPLMADIAIEIRRFGAVTFVTNALLGVAVAAGLALWGVDDAWLWGLTAAALHLVPYAGLAVIMGLAALEVYALSASVLQALAIAGYVGLLGVSIGTALLAWLQGRASRVDSAVTFGGTVFFSVLWGGWGLVLGPLMVVVARVVWRHARGVAGGSADDARAVVRPIVTASGRS